MRLLFSDKNMIAKVFAGRAEERSSLSIALSDVDGGTVLLSGDRGSGKSRLIKEAVESIKSRIGGKVSPLDKTINVEIPLITPPLTEDESIDRGALRGLLLRSIVHALWAEYTSNYWTRYKPVIYRSKLKSLVKRTEYSKMLHTLNMGASLEKLKFANAKAALNRTWQGELDLSDIKLELYLTDLLKRYGSKYKFIVVFDELDKFEDKITPTNYIEELKNFFTATKATYIFVSTESFYGVLQSKITSSPYSKEHTLFTKTMLINQILPVEFSKLIDETFLPSSRDKAGDQYKIFKLALMWSSNLYPYDFKRIISELRKDSDKKPYIEIEDAQLPKQLLESTCTSARNC